MPAAPTGWCIARAGPLQVQRYLADAVLGGIMTRRLIDRKSWLAYIVFSWLNKLVVRWHFKQMHVRGLENIPQSGPFLLVSNHISRFDGLVIHELIGRPSNWMVSPNELKGLQGVILRSMGAFPANALCDLVNFLRLRTAQGEGIVIFPEGDIYRDGATHPFKNGAARIALSCAKAGIPFLLVPLAVSYNDGLWHTASVNIGEPIELEMYLRDFSPQSNMGIRDLTVRLFREVCQLRQNLGENKDNLTLFTGRAVKTWVKRRSAALSKLPETNCYETDKSKLARTLVG